MATLSTTSTSDSGPWPYSTFKTANVTCQPKTPQSVPLTKIPAAGWPPPGHLHDHHEPSPPEAGGQLLPNSFVCVQYRQLTQTSGEQQSPEPASHQVSSAPLTAVSPSKRKMATLLQTLIFLISPVTASRSPQLQSPFLCPTSHCCQADHS